MIVRRMVFHVGKEAAGIQTNLYEFPTIDEAESYFETVTRANTDTEIDRFFIGITYINDNDDEAEDETEIFSAKDVNI